jgi:hypothetical protein
LTKLISRAATPPTCGSQALNDIDKWTCTLQVPKSSLEAYQAADQWKEFFFIEEGEEPFILGDADGDGVVDVNDVTTTINHILGKPVANFVREAANIDGDDSIDVNDVQGIIDIALGKRK